MSAEMPEQVRQFVEAATANAREVLDEIIAKDVMYACQEKSYEDRWVVSDNYERFFATIYIYDPKTDTWTTRPWFSDTDDERPYDFNRVMADAAILFTG
jgi:hypothetical protein